ncbi:hypothetical protein RFI_33426, partial [Reticulomyxa filosa]
MTATMDPANDRDIARNLAESEKDKKKSALEMTTETLQKIGDDIKENTSHLVNNLVYEYFNKENRSMLRDVIRMEPTNNESSESDDGDPQEEANRNNLLSGDDMSLGLVPSHKPAVLKPRSRSFGEEQFKELEVHE